MAGQFGNVRTTTLNLQVVEGDAERNLLLVRGAVPGPAGGIVFVRNAVKSGGEGMSSLTMKTADAAPTAAPSSCPIDIFGIEPNVAVMHQVVTAQLAAKRAGTHSTKTRAEVRGGGAKPWRQKGTGRARQGSIRAPQWRGGGVAHGPKPRDYSQRTPKKMVRLALRSALSDRASEQQGRGRRRLGHRHAEDQGRRQAARGDRPAAPRASAKTGCSSCSTATTRTRGSRCATSATACRS